MTLPQSRSTYSWTGAIALGPALVSLAEALPAHEQNGLVMQLQQLMVELPAMITHDLVIGGETRHDSVFRLVAALELIDRIYPALDGADAREALDTLAERLSGPNFQEVIAPPAVAVAPVAEDAPAADAPISFPDTITLQPTAQEEHVIHVQPSSGQ